MSFILWHTLAPQVESNLHICMSDTGIVSMPVPVIKADVQMTLSGLLTKQGLSMAPILRPFQKPSCALADSRCT